MKLQFVLSSVLFLACACSAWCGSDGRIDVTGDHLLPLRHELRFFQPINEHLLKRWIERLTLSDAQEKVLRTLFDRYLAVVEPLVPEMKQLNVSAWRIGDGYRDGHLNGAEYADLLEPMVADAERCRRRLISAEDAFFDELTPVLADNQLDQVTSLRASRMRAWYAVETGALPGAQVDLAAAIESLSLAREEQELVQAIVEEYSLVLVPLVKNRHEIMHDNRIKSIRHTASATAYDEAFLAQRKRMFAPRIDLDRRLKEINRTYFKRLVTALPDDSARELTEHYYAVILPPMHPDTISPRVKNMLASLLNHPLLEEDQQRYLERVRGEYWKRLDDVCEALHDEYFRYMAAFQSTFSMNVNERQRHQDAIQSLVNRRDGYGHEMLREIPTLLTDEQIAWYASQSSRNDRASNQDQDANEGQE